MDNYESSKENVRPLKSGRRFDCLVNSINQSTTELEARKAEFEIQKQECTGEDLLNVYYEYIIWIEQNRGSDETLLKSIVEECLDYFFKIPDNDIFKDDKKLLSIFLKHTSMCNSPLQFFKSAYLSGFFKKISQFYLEWSYYYEVINDMEHAMKILEGASTKKAKPSQTIENAIKRLKQRSNNDQNEPLMNIIEQRKAFNRLEVQRSNIAPVDRVNNVVHLPVQSRALRPQGSSQPGPSSKSSQPSTANDNFLIPDDNVLDNDEELKQHGPVSLPFEKQAVPQSIKGNENVIKPGKWSENAMKQLSKSANQKEGFKVLVEKDEAVKKSSKSESKATDYSMYSWAPIAEQMFTPSEEFSFEELRYKKWQEKKKMELEAKLKNEKFDQFVAPKPVIKKEDKDLEALEAMETNTDEHKFVSPTELLDVTVNRDAYKTLDFTVSNFQTQDFNPCSGSTPLLKRTKVSLAPVTLSPLIEVSYKSSSSSGGYTTTQDTDKSMPPQEIYDYPFKLKSIEFMLKSLKLPIDKRSGALFMKYTNFSRNFLIETQSKNSNSATIYPWNLGKHECRFFIDNFKTFDGFDVLLALTSSSKPEEPQYLRLYIFDDGRWDFYIRTEIQERLKDKKDCLLYRTVHDSFFYDGSSVTVKPDDELYLFDELPFHEFPFVAAFVIHQLIKIIEYLHSVKIVCGKISQKNIVFRKFKNLKDYFVNEFIEIVNYSSAADLSIIPANYIPPLNKFHNIDWLGLLGTVCAMLLRTDVGSEDVESKIKDLSELKGEEPYAEYMSELGRILSKMFHYIFNNNSSSSLDLTQYKNELDEFKNMSDELLRLQISKIFSNHYRNNLGL